MDTIKTGDIWKEVRSYARLAKRRMVAVAYVSVEGHIGLRRKDVLICDASDGAIRSGETSARLLWSLHQRGIEVYSYPDLHAKAAVFGCYALIGSCNLSISSAERLTELAILTDRKQVVNQAKAFIYNLREKADNVDDSFLKRILKIQVQKAKRRAGIRKRQVMRLGNKVWLVAARQLSDNSYPEEKSIVEKGGKKAQSLVTDKDTAISWLRWTGKSRFRIEARPGDEVIQISKPQSGKRIVVRSRCPIVYRQDVAHWTRFYTLEAEDDKTLSWEHFQKAAESHGLSSISKNSVRELRPRELLALEGIWGLPQNG